NAVPTCTDGGCAIVECLPNFADCDGNPANGCEVDLRTSAAHCGACQNACTPPGGTGVCTDGNCGIGTCSAGRADCNGVYADGCEVDTTTNAAHCGACNAACTVANGTGQ